MAGARWSEQFGKRMRTGFEVSCIGRGPTIAGGVNVRDLKNTFKGICTLLVFIAGAKIEVMEKFQIRNILHEYLHGFAEEKPVYQCQCQRDVEQNPDRHIFETCELA